MLFLHLKIDTFCNEKSYSGGDNFSIAAKTWQIKQSDQTTLILYLAALI